MTEKEKAKYILLFLCVTAVWGFAFVVVKSLINQGVGTFTMLMVRFAVGAAVVAALRPVLKSPKIRKKEVFHGFLMGAVIFIGFAFQTGGAQYTTSARSGLLTGLYVIFTPLAGIVAARKLKIKPMLEGVVCLVGLMIFFGVFGQETDINRGDLYTIVCAVFFTLQFLILEKYSPDLNTMNYTLFQLIAVTLYAAVGMLFTEGGISPAVFFWKPAMELLYLGVLSTAMAYAVQTLIQAKLSAATVSVVACTESIFSVLFSLMLGYETMTVNYAVGGIILILTMLSSASGDRFPFPGKRVVEATEQRVS